MSLWTCASMHVLMDLLSISFDELCELTCLMDLWTYICMLEGLVDICMLHVHGTCEHMYAICINSCYMHGTLCYMYDYYAFSNFCCYIAYLSFWTTWIKWKEIKKGRKLHLCHVQTHDKGVKNPLPCFGTRQRGHVARTCRPGSDVLDQMVILSGPNTRQTHMYMTKLAHTKVWGPPFVIWQWKPDTQQRWCTRQAVCRVYTGTRQKGPPPLRTAEAKAPLLCRVSLEKHGRPTAVPR
jgi:hypothetical protein